MTANRGFAANHTRETARRHEKVESFIRRPRTTPRKHNTLLLQHAASNPDAASAEGILGLQSNYGNRAVSSLLSGMHRPIVQAVLHVGPVGDSYEREADRVAQQVMNMPAPAVSQSALQRRESGGVQMSPLVSSITPIVQRQEEEEEPLNEGDVATTSLVQRQEDDAFEASDGIEARLNALQGGGSPLSHEVRAFMEPRFGADFGGVRIHTGGAAAQISRSLGAQAFTYGRDIYFGQSKYSPGSDAGKRLLAHELTHVVQQKGATVRRQDEEEQGQEQGQEQEQLGNLAGGQERPELEVEKGPDDRKMDGPGKRSSASTSGTSAAKRPGEYTIDVDNVDVGVSHPETHSPAPRGHKDTVSIGSVGVNWSNPGGKPTSAFGSESFNPTWKSASYKTETGGKVKLSFTIDVKCPWGVNSGGNIDVPSGTDSVVTKDNYKKIVSDLTPVLVEKSWRAPRDKYWSKAICERHEKYHSTDDEKWSKGAGKTVVTDYLKGKTVSSGSLADDLKGHLDDAMDEMYDSNMNDFYKGGATSYYSYAGEERAFGDGKVPYQELAAAVKVQGDKLKKAAKPWYKFW